MIVIRRGYERKYQVGGSGIFSKLKDFLSGFISKKQVVDTALNIARSAGQKAGHKAIDFAGSKLTPKSQKKFIKTCVFNTSACTSSINTTEGTTGDTKFEQLGSWVGSARNQDSRPCQTIE